MLNKVRSSLYEKKDRGTVAGIIINIVLIALALILSAEIIFSMRYTGIYVVNISMTPTLMGANVIGYDNAGRPIADTSGDYVYIKTGAKPRYGDIVVVYRPDVGDNIIKRAVAFGGDRVQFIEGWLYINGERQEEKYISDEYRTAANNQYYNYPANGEQHTVEKGKVFLLGDNRNHSDDSRRYGDYDLQNVLGVVPAWSVKLKEFTTAMHSFFYFKLRGKTTAEIPAENILLTA